MKVLQIGVPKSGNFWLYNILKQTMIRSGNSHRSFIEQHPIHPLAKTWDLNYPTQADVDMIDITDLQTSYRISSIFRMPVDHESEYYSKTDHVWTHSPFCNASSSVFQHFSKKVYIIRDPRDVLLSASRYYCSPYMLKYFPHKEKDPQQFLENNLEELLHHWVWHVWDYLRVRKQHNIHLVFFEGLIGNFQKELSLLLEYLETDLSQEQRLAVEKEMDFNQLKKKNPKHLKKGRSGYWMDQLTEEQLEKVEILAGPLIGFLGYPAQNEEMTFSRKFPHQDFQTLKEAIIQSQQEFYDQLPHAQLSSYRF